MFNTYISLCSLRWTLNSHDGHKLLSVHILRSQGCSRESSATNVKNVNFRLVKVKLRWSNKVPLLSSLSLSSLLHWPCLHCCCIFFVFVDSVFTVVSESGANTDGKSHIVTRVHVTLLHCYNVTRVHKVISGTGTDGKSHVAQVQIKKCICFEL